MKLSRTEKLISHALGYKVDLTLFRFFLVWAISLSLIILPMNEGFKAALANNIESELFRLVISCGMFMLGPVIFFWLIPKVSLLKKKNCKENS